MLNEHLDYRLLTTSVVKRNYVLRKSKKDHNWRGGTIPVPYKGAKASSVKAGALVTSTDISENTFVRGTLSTQKEIWAAMIFNHKDLIQHGGTPDKPGQISEQSFLQSFPDQLEEFVDDVKQMVSIMLLTGGHFATLTSDATGNDGTIVVDRPEYFQMYQKVIVQDSDASPATGYVGSININTSTIILYTTRGGATAVDFDANNMTTAKSARCYFDGFQTSDNQYMSIRNQILSSANGGSANHLGVAKTTWPFLQSKNIDGSSITAYTMLDDIYQAWVDTEKQGRGKPTDAVMGMQNLAYCLKLLEAGSGPYKHVGTRASLYGWTEVIINGIRGPLKLIGVNEMNETEVFFMDWRFVKLHTNGGFRVHKDMDGKQYFTVRNTTGYQYIVDLCMMGEFVISNLSHQGCLYGISI
jgi:hypothetical protein